MLKLDDSYYSVVFYRDGSSGARLDADGKVEDGETLFAVVINTAHIAGNDSIIVFYFSTLIYLIFLYICLKNKSILWHLLKQTILNRF